MKEIIIDFNNVQRLIDDLKRQLNALVFYAHEEYVFVFNNDKAKGKIVLIHIEDSCFNLYFKFKAKQNFNITFYNLNSACINFIYLKKGQFNYVVAKEYVDVIFGCSKIQSAISSLNIKTTESLKIEKGKCFENNMIKIYNKDYLDEIAGNLDYKRVLKDIQIIKPISYLGSSINQIEKLDELLVSDEIGHKRIEDFKNQIKNLLKIQIDFFNNIKSFL